MKNRVDAKTMKVIAEVINCMMNNPEKVITGHLGNGCHARAYKTLNGQTMHKVVIPGDNFDMAKLQLKYLLSDLAIDCGLSDEKIDQLENILK